jgi:hypothetical protein
MELFFFRAPPSPLLPGTYETCVKLCSKKEHVLKNNSFWTCCAIRRLHFLQLRPLFMISSKQLCVFWISSVLLESAWSSSDVANNICKPRKRSGQLYHKMLQMHKINMLERVQTTCTINASVCQCENQIASSGLVRTSVKSLRVRSFSQVAASLSLAT